MHCAFFFSIYCHQNRHQNSWNNIFASIFYGSLRRLLKTLGSFRLTSSSSSVINWWPFPFMIENSYSGQFFSKTDFRKNWLTMYRNHFDIPFKNSRWKFMDRNQANGILKKTCQKLTKTRLIFRYNSANLLTIALNWAKKTVLMIETKNWSKNFWKKNVRNLKKKPMECAICPNTIYWVLSSCSHVFFARIKDYFSIAAKGKIRMGK